MRTFFYALAIATTLLIVIVFFQNLGSVMSANVMVLGSKTMSVKSGTIVFFSATSGAIAAMLACFGVYYDQIFGKKETVWTGTQKQNVTETQTKDQWENNEW